MKKNIFILLVALLCSCSTGTKLQTVVKVNEHTEFVPYIVPIEIPEIKESVTTRDTTSLLENSFSKSVASICPDGSLYHSLETKPQTIEKTIETRIVYRDSIVVDYQYIEVPAELTGFQRFQLRWFWILLIIVAGRIAIFCIFKK